MTRGEAFRRLVRIPCRLAAPTGKALALGLPLVLASSLDVGAAASESPAPPAGTESVKPSQEWLDGLTGPVRTRRGALPEDEVPPDTPVVPVGGDPQVLVLAGPVNGTPLSGAGPEAAATQAMTSSGIPVRVLRAYVAAAQVMAARDPACKISWSLLAGIGRVESNHGRFGGAVVTASGRVSPPILGPLLDGRGFAAIRDTDGGRWDGNTAYDRAVGPMQFIPGTWQAYGGDGNGDGVNDPQNIDDAALGAARYLCAGEGDLSTQAGRWSAVFRYNHSNSYVSLVLGLADSYASGHATALPTQPPGVTKPSGPPASTTNPRPVTPPPAPGPGPTPPPTPPPPTTPPTVPPTTAPTTAPTTVPTTLPCPTTSPTAPPTPTTGPTTCPTTPPTTAPTTAPTTTPTTTPTTPPTTVPTAPPTSSPAPEPTTPPAPTPTTPPEPTPTTPTAPPTSSPAPAPSSGAPAPSDAPS